MYKLKICPVKWTQCIPYETLSGPDGPSKEGVRLRQVSVRGDYTLLLKVLWNENNNKNNTRRTLKNAA